MGVSQGGKIAQVFAADCPKMTEALILAVTAPYANETVAERGDHRDLMIDTAEHSYTEAYLRKYRKGSGFTVVSGSAVGASLASK